MGEVRSLALPVRILEEGVFWSQRWPQPHVCPPQMPRGEAGTTVVGGRGSPPECGAGRRAAGRRGRRSLPRALGGAPRTEMLS